MTFNIGDLDAIRRNFKETDADASKECLKSIVSSAEGEQRIDSAKRDRLFACIEKSTSMSRVALELLLALIPRKRGCYKCRLCDQLLKGHTCEYCEVCSTRSKLIKIEKEHTHIYCVMCFEEGKKAKRIKQVKHGSPGCPHHVDS